MNGNNDYMSKQEWESIWNNRSVRMRMARGSLYLFSHLYFGEYIQYPTAGFHHEIYGLLQDESLSHLGIVAFRGSGKSTIATTLYPLWAVLGHLGKKYVVIVSQTQSQAQSHLKNVKRELEENPLFKKDFGDLKEETDEWGSMSLVIPGCNARISAVSTEQSIRGTRHGPHRPDLIISDDIEDIHSVKNSEYREKLFQWYASEVIPAGDINTKYVVVGNLLHVDSFMMRLKAHYSGRANFAFKEYPLINDEGECLWPEKFPTAEDLEALRDSVPSERAWYREYLLFILPDNRQVVQHGDIVRYDAIPQRVIGGVYKTAIGTDLAISKNTTADFTALVVLEKHVVGDNTRIYVHPFPVNKRNNFAETVQNIKDLKLKHPRAEIYIEDVSMQRAIIEMLKQEHIRAEPVSIKGRDKQERLEIVAYWIKEGIVVFPQHGVEELVNQIVNFGVEKDDLLDAFTLGVIRLMENVNTANGTAYIGRHNLYNRIGR